MTYRKVRQLLIGLFWRIGASAKLYSFTTIIFRACLLVPNTDTTFFSINQTKCELNEVLILPLIMILSLYRKREADD